MYSVTTYNVLYACKLTQISCIVLIAHYCAYSTLFLVLCIQHIISCCNVLYALTLTRTCMCTYQAALQKSFSLEGDLSEAKKVRQFFL